jgi:hypothetical protein
MGLNLSNEQIAQELEIDGVWSERTAAECERLVSRHESPPHRYQRTRPAA